MICPRCGHEVQRQVWFTWESISAFVYRTKGRPWICDHCWQAKRAGKLFRGAKLAWTDKEAEEMDRGTNKNHQA
jgi:hypothetical protein